MGLLYIYLFTFELGLGFLVCYSLNRGRYKFQSSILQSFFP